VSFSPDAYVASFPDKYLQHLVLTYGNREGFGVTIGEVINMEKHLYGGGVSKNWHKLFNPFDHVEQIRGSLNYIADEFKKIVSWCGLFLIQHIKRRCLWEAVEIWCGRRCISAEILDEAPFSYF